jgi:hypothetical protein
MHADHSFILKNLWKACDFFDQKVQDMAFRLFLTIDIASDDISFIQSKRHYSGTHVSKIFRKRQFIALCNYLGLSHYVHIQFSDPFHCIDSLDLNSIHDWIRTIFNVEVQVDKKQSEASKTDLMNWLLWNGANYCFRKRLRTMLGTPQQVGFL